MPESRGRIGVVVLVVTLVAGAVVVQQQRTKERRGGWTDDERDVPGEAIATPWPPAKGQTYPDVALQDPSGKTVRLSSFKGKVIVVEPIGMACPACNAFAGAEGLSAFRSASYQQGLPSYAEIAAESGLDLDHPDLVFVHLLLYDMSNRQAPTLKDGRDWAAHWELNDKPNMLVLVSDPRYINQASYDLVPGFQLIDKSFTLQVDSSGHHPQDSYQDVFSTAADLLNE